MAKAVDKPAETAAPKVTFVARPVTALPKREAPKNEPDLASANALLVLLSATVDDGTGTQVASTASNGTVHGTAQAARGAANKAKRLLAHVLPDGQVIKTRVYASGDGHEWAVWIEAAKAEAETSVS